MRARVSSEAGSGYACAIAVVTAVAASVGGGIAVVVSVNGVVVTLERDLG